MHFGTDPFVPVRTPFFVTVSTVFHGQIRIFGTGGIAINIVTNFSYWLREIHRVLEYQFNVGKEPLLKVGEKRNIYNSLQRLRKRMGKESEGMEKNLLKNKSRKEPGKRGGTFPSEGLVKSTGKGGRDKKVQVDSSSRSWKKGKVIVKEMILTE